MLIFYLTTYNYTHIWCKLIFIDPSQKLIKSGENYFDYIDPAIRRKTISTLGITKKMYLENCVGMLKEMRNRWRQ